jgi:hypothetical protein
MGSHRDTAFAKTEFLVLDDVDALFEDLIAARNAEIDDAFGDEHGDVLHV